MPVAKRNLRSLRDIKTLSGRAGDDALPHRGYMRLACLEMEKARRMLEWKNAIRRLQQIDARLQEIEAEEAVIRRRLGSPTETPQETVPPGRPMPGPARGKRRQFKVKY
jgi:hypothetical protein